MWHELALALGHRSVAEAKQHISSSEFTAWVAYDRISPLGMRRVDILFARLMWLLAEVNRDQKRRRRPFSVTDFLPPWDPLAGAPPRKKTSNELLKMVELANAALGGKDLREQRGH